MQRRFLGLLRRGDQTRGQIYQEVRDTAVARVFAWRDVVELVISSFNEGALPQYQLVHYREEVGLHIFAELGDEVHPLPQEGGEERLGDIPPIAKDFPLQPLTPVGNRRAVIDLGGRQTTGSPLTKVIEEEMPLKAGSPAAGILAPGRYPSNDCRAGGPLGRANRAQRSIKKRPPLALPLPRVPRGAEGDEDRGPQLHTPRITPPVRNILVPMGSAKAQQRGCARALSGLRKPPSDRPPFTHTHPPSSRQLRLPCGLHLRLPGGRKL